ncbi:hypothetical protein AB0O67_07515 [Streptomyces sp. NPDC086077]|uniref:hypothetical protein n=1 Tax=Streptomyces sp. NPDC086077 TaxID=3154862 RepID=UPI00342EFA1B
MNPTRRTVLLAGATAALLPSLPAAAAPRPAAAALQPYASYWYPDSLPSGTPGTGITWRSLKAWRAADDADLAFNAASVPLAPRFTPAPANPTARAGQARIQSLVSFGPVVQLTHRADTGGVIVELAVATAEPGTPGATPPYTYFPVNPAGAWQTSAVRLTGLSGTIRALGVRLTPTTPGAPVRWRLGGLAVRADQPPRTPAAPNGFRVTAASGGDVRFAWQPAPGEVRHHTLHRVLPDGSRRFLGGTCQRAWFAGGLRPEQGERVARFELRSVGELYTSSDPVTVNHTW